MKGYKLKVISLNGNRKLINATKKAGLEVFNPTGAWNGYGYEKLPLAVVIKSLADMRKFNKIKAENENKPTETLSEEDKKEKWAKRLSKLTGIDIAEAIEIANEKIEYKDLQISKLEDRQAENYSAKREKLIDKMRRENPLRRIENEEHAQAILTASKRHNLSNYEQLLDEARELAEIGEIDRGDVKEYARTHLQYV